jgi:hypothetical protein
MSKSLLIKQLGTWILISFATLAYLEVGLRLIGRAALPLLRTDPEVGSIHVKEFQGNVWDERSQQSHYIKTNNLGYIGDRNISPIVATGTTRIAILGDSLVEAQQVDFYHNFSHLLQTALNISRTCSQTFEVLNFGVGGTGTFSQYQTFKYKIASLHPDLTLLVFHDDYLDNLQKSGFNLENYAQERTSVGLKAFLLQFQLPKFVFSKVQSSTTVIYLLRMLGFYESSGIVGGASNNPSTEPSFLGYTFDLLKKMDALVRASGSKLIVVVYSDEKHSAYIDAWKQDSQMAALTEFLTREQITFVNPANDLAKAKVNISGCLTYDCEDHFNQQGHEIMARFLYQTVKTHLGINNRCQTPSL